MHEIDWKQFSAMTMIEKPLQERLSAWFDFLKSETGIVTILEQGELAITQQAEKEAALCIKQGCSLVEQENQSLFPLVFLAYVLPASLALFAEKKIPDMIVKDTFSDVGRWVAAYGKTHQGAYGFDRYYWILHHFCAHLFQIGRLQYEVGTFAFPYTIYRCKQDNSLVCLADKNLQVNASGHLCGTNGNYAGKWETLWSVQGGSLLANRVDLETGTIVQTPVQFSYDDLDLLVQKGSPVLHLHISEGSPLTPAEVTESIKKAKTFFSDLHITFNALLCDSWLLDPNLSKFLPEEGNICSFMRRFSKFPVLHEHPQILERVLGPLAPTTGSSLGRLLIEYLQKGGSVYTTGGFLTEEMFMQ
ncbi:hypothetical protein SpiGrapes_1827 [Sphaerochaeta pleomorpha str. Grapes]|uniref:Uncharacterized protein n=1 Tax=Sphaerochaeta pleomorpha (strain ATCC BAA-1885 / DSM 22778 / Grapes) TaxID=158190 RepID=G8QY57_SPHPG|nr:acyltransferase domain-containing protein [Sphaerochaeta pleomorpha]AEV29622.1 hypothetical protein SpiGrapes_1827 [Sphaerochaeta pleomorpha str. Grapes]